MDLYACEREKNGVVCIIIWDVWEVLCAFFDVGEEKKKINIG
jgi:hypothetical protein